MRLRLVDGRPSRAVPTPCLQGVTERVAAAGKTALLMVWEQASWHVSHAVRAWLTAHHRRVKREGGWRVGGCPVPINSPWRKRIAPQWGHGKRAIAAPERTWRVDDLQPRICAYDHCELLDPMTQ
jgi:hypothetical protein